MRVMILCNRPFLTVLRSMLERCVGVEIDEATTGEQAVQQARVFRPDLLLLDSGVREGGVEPLRTCRGSGLSMPAVMLSCDDAAMVREALSVGAQGFVSKAELCPRQLLSTMSRIAAGSRACEVARIAGSSTVMRRLRMKVLQVADLDVPILIEGERGTGRSLVARALHEHDLRQDRRLSEIHLDCLSPEAAEARFFGSGVGSLVHVGDGTLVLHEITETSPELRARLIALAELRRWRPSGALHDLVLGARLIATARVSAASANEQAFGHSSPDHRFGITIRTPALRDHHGDIPELAEAFAREVRPGLEFSGDALRWLSRQAWPGNIRELKTAITRAAAFATGNRLTEGHMKAFAESETAHSSRGEPSSAEARLPVLAQQLAIAAGSWNLTRREAHVLSLIAEGKQNKEIAVELGTSIGTVEFHVGNVLRKAKAERRAGLVSLVWGMKPSRRDLSDRG